MARKIKQLGNTTWDTAALHKHLQDAVDLEFWTIPFYMSALYSIKDPADSTYRLIQSIVYQEMLHVELASNIANAYGLSPTFKAPKFVDPKDGSSGIPHLNFKLDSPNPTSVFKPHTAQIGPLDLAHINAFCLVEYPEWKTGLTTDPLPKTESYGSIGGFYDAVTVGASELRDMIIGNMNQVNIFQNFYNNFADQIITKDGSDGFAQVMTLIDAITEQGEGATEGNDEIPLEFRNTADGFEEELPHYHKFIEIRDILLFDQKKQPEVYTGVPNPPAKSTGAAAQDTLIKNFALFSRTLETLFSTGSAPPDFGSQMATLGANILNCWKNGAYPKYS